MKKSLLLFFAALAIPMLVSAITLADNQKLLGHYTTDDIATSGWGQTFLAGDNTVAIELTAEELGLFQGSKIVAFRVGLAESTPVSRVFVIPVSPEGIEADGVLGEVTEWTCNVSSQGWNLIELETPYEINLPEGYRLLVGFDYEQATKQSKPLAAVKVGTIYKSYHYRSGKWKGYGLEIRGNLCLQCIAENDNFPKYVIMMRDLSCRPKVKTGDNLDFQFKACNLGVGQVPAGACEFQVAIDGEVRATVTNDQALTDNYSLFTAAVSTAGLAEGDHTLTVTAISANGEAIENPTTLSCSFATFDNGFTRQMRLVEQFTSTECTWCPLGSQSLQALCDMRGDIAWVGIHLPLSYYDPLNTAQCDTIAGYMGANSFPTGAFDRTPGADPESPNSLLTGLAYNSPAYGASVYNDFLNGSKFVDPAWASVNINSTFDPESREAVITIDGELVPDYDKIMGNDSKLTVYITEDGLVASQIDQGVEKPNYVHNGVLRLVLGSASGVALKTTGDAYENEFTVQIPESWVVDNLNIVAFISRPLRKNAVNDIYVTNCNKRKFGEYDEPEVLKGDINGDKTIDVADVVALIDVVLSDNAAGVENAVADLNNDNTIDVADVVALIDLVLSN